MIELVDVAQRVSDTVAVIDRTGEREDTRWLADDAPGLGPMGGLKTALTHHGHSLIFACDMPRVDVASLRRLFEETRNSTARHGVSTAHGGQIGPFFPKSPHRIGIGVPVRVAGQSAWLAVQYA